MCLAQCSRDSEFEYTLSFIFFLFFLTLTFHVELYFVSIDKLVMSINIFFWK